MGPALAGLTLGIVGRQNFDRQYGRNQVANQAGNIAAAALSGCLGAWLGMPYIFALSAAFGAGCILTALWIPPGSVHRHYARGFAKDDADDASDIHPDALRVLLHNRSLLVLSAALAAFNLGNSAMLPLYSLAVASTHAADPSHVTAANIVISQIVMLIAAAYASRAIRRFGFWWIILATLATLPLRAVTAAFVPLTWGVLPVQVFDGLGAGFQSVAVPALVVHLLHGSGRVIWARARCWASKRRAPVLARCSAAGSRISTAFRPRSWRSEACRSYRSRSGSVMDGACGKHATRGATNSASCPTWIRRR